MEITVPDLGDFHDVAVIEIAVKAGEAVRKEQPLLTLETDKATMDVPSPYDGTIKEMLVAVGAKVSKGSRIAVMELAEAALGAPAAFKPASASAPSRPPSAPSPRNSSAISPRHER